MKTPPLYEQIVTDLRNKILAGEYEPNTKLPAENELAKLYHVSRITSKRALEELKNEGFIYRVRGSGSFVSDRSVPTCDVKSSKSAGSKTVAILMPHHVTESSFAQSINGAIKRLSQAGYYGIVQSSVKNAVDERNIIQKMVEDGIQGIIYYPLSDHDNFQLLYSLRLKEYPMVVIDRYLQAFPLNCVISDNYEGGRMATEHLIKLGHSKIAFVSDLPLESATSIRDRYFGYADAMKQYHKNISADFVFTDFADEYHRGYHAETYTNILRQLQANGIQAVFAMNDSIAIHLMRAAKELDISIPKELSIVGFDDLKVAKHLPIPLTTVRQNFVDIGKLAAEIILNQIESGVFENKQIKLPVNLIIRDSTGMYQDL